MKKILPDIMTIDETSMYLRIPLSSLYKLAQEGKIPCQKVGKHWRFRREAIDRWLEAAQLEASTNGNSQISQSSDDANLE